MCALDFQLFVGGKGANQAYAAAKLGAASEMAGCVGSDGFGHRLRDELRSAGVDITRVRDGRLPSGTATIMVLPDGENVIVISSGANGEITVPVAIEAVDDLRSGDVLLCQLEIPIEAIDAAMQRAWGHGVTTVLDPAPACPLPAALLKAITILTPNQTEAGMLLAKPPVESVSEAREAALALRELGPRKVIIKLGAQGCVVLDDEAATWVPGFSVDAIDATAAGDAFNGALATALTRGQALLDATRFACAAAAISVTRLGATPSLACLAEVETLLASHPSTV